MAYGLYKDQIITVLRSERDNTFLFFSPGNKIVYYCPFAQKWFPIEQHTYSRSCYYNNTPVPEDIFMRDSYTLIGRFIGMATKRLFGSIFYYDNNVLLFTTAPRNLLLLRNAFLSYTHFFFLPSGNTFYRYDIFVPRARKYNNTMRPNDPCCA